MTPTSTGSASGAPRSGVEAGEPEQVVDQAPDALALAVDPLERRAGRRSGSRCPARARLVWASMTETGVRSSCEASALNASWRCRARSIGAATRRPMTTAPMKTSEEQHRPDDQLGQEEGRLGRRQLGRPLPDDHVAIAGAGAGHPDVHPADADRLGRRSPSSRRPAGRRRRCSRSPSRSAAPSRRAGSGRRGGRGGGASKPPPGPGWSGWFVMWASAVDQARVELAGERVREQDERAGGDREVDRRHHERRRRRRPGSTAARTSRAGPGHASSSR